jgi:catalase
MSRANYRAKQESTASKLIMLLAVVVFASFPAWCESAPDIARQIADIMSQSPRGMAHQRFVHAKGIVSEGTFEASPEAATVSRAAHFRGGSVPVTVRFSDGAPDVAIPDNSPQAGPQGMAIRFMTSRGTDIVGMSHHGIAVGTPEEFLALQKAAAATDPAKPHPWPIEEFLGNHPRALKFVQDNAAVPASFTTQSFFGNNACRFVDSKGNVRVGRYQLVPENGTQYLDESASKAKSPDFLREDLRTRLAAGAVKYRLWLQVAGPEDRTDDPSIVWPEDHKKIELGVITISSIVADSTQAEKDLAFDPARLTDGIELSDDPFPALRSRVYAISAAGRRNH